MRVKIFYFLFLCLLVSFSLSCKKEDTSVPLVQTKSIKVFSDNNIYWTVGAVAGDGVVLLVYVDNSLEFKFKLIDNTGKEIWTKTYGYKYQLGSQVFLQVLLDADNTFAIIYNGGLKKIDLDGNIVFNNDSFLGSINNVSVYRVTTSSNNSYLILGTFSSRAYIAEVSKEGLVKFSRLYAFSVNGSNTYTDVIKLSNGGYLAAGIFNSNTPTLKSAFYITSLNSTGIVEYTKKTDIDSCDCQGREFLKLSDNNYALLVSPYGDFSKENRSRLYITNDSADILNIKYIDLSDRNYGSGHSPFFGNGLLKNNSGNLIGIIKTAYEITTASAFSNATSHNYSKPQYDYVYTLNTSSYTLNQFYINKNYSTYYNSIVKMSNGKTLIFGAIMSLGDELKLMIIQN